MTALAGLLAIGIPFIQPLPIAGWMRLWMFLPLAFCVAVVYRATRARETDRILRSAFFSFVNISVGMVLIALAAYGIHWLALRWTA